jgi:hypothetical protein
MASLVEEARKPVPEAGLSALVQDANALTAAAGGSTNTALLAFTPADLKRAERGKKPGPSRTGASKRGSGPKKGKANPPIAAKGSAPSGTKRVTPLAHKRKRTPQRRNRNAGPPAKDQLRQERASRTKKITPVVHKSINLVVNIILLCVVTYCRRLRLCSITATNPLPP